MAENPYLPLFVTDYLAATDHLTDAEHGIYLRLLMVMWQSPECRLPDDDVWLARRFRRTELSVKNDMRPLMHEFFAMHNGWITQKRLQKEWRWRKEKSEKNRGAAKARWNNEKLSCERNAPTLPHPIYKEDDDDSAKPASDGLITKEAIELSDKISRLMGFHPKEIPAAWCGAAYKIQAWISGGWSADLIYAGIEKQMAGRTGPPSTIKYFEKGIADFIAEQNSPLPKGQINGHRGPRPLQDDSRSASRAAARLAEQAERGEFKFAPRPGLSASQSRIDVQLLSKGRDPQS